MNEPVLTKRESRGDDYKTMTWDIFLKLKNYAKYIANKTSYKVYLVGSVLEKEIPRDIDISVVMPFEEYERLYGKWPQDTAERNKYMAETWRDNVEYYFGILEAVDNKVYIDLKFCPDSWWVEKDKLLLAEPIK